MRVRLRTRPGRLGEQRAHGIGRQSEADLFERRRGPANIIDAYNSLDRRCG